ncbi:MAG: phage tail tube protein [Deltaproteobacteria bacterium]|nr:phage tail tube protein [Deltaproteobacteria bacterium]
MADNKYYLGIGEEANRGTAESTTVGFIPLLSPGLPKMEFDDKRRKEFRGEDSVLGDTQVMRMSQKWSASVETPFFTESGGSSWLVGTLLKHFFGKATSSQNGTTGQYRHLFYPIADHFSAANLGDKALTLNYNINEGATMKNWPFVGGRVKALSFEQEAGNHLKLTAELFGQKRNASSTAIASPTFAVENMRCDYNNLSVYTGTITRTGTAPAYTDFSFGSATQIKPDKVSLKIENGMEDVLRLSGLDYADKTRLGGQYKVSLEMTLDWEDPSSGFSSVDDLLAWLISASSTNFHLHWNTGFQAGTGDNHGLYIDLPVMQRVGGEPDYSLEKDPMVTLKYEGLYDATTCKYMVGLLLKNTSWSV